MAEVNDGGPAFPGQSDQEMGINGQWREPWFPGMSLRDYFAAAAVTGILSNRAASLGPIDTTEFASDAYAVADAMLAERAKK